jgi:outer membrane immunogenic protein
MTDWGTSIVKRFSRTSAARLSLRAAVSTLALSSVLSGATAADLGGGRGYRPPPPVAPQMALERWTGFYLGAAIGGTWGDTSITGDFGSGTIGTNGWNAAILAGYNWQVDRLVLGVEADLGTGSFGGSASNGIDRYGIDFNAFGSLRGRLGFLLTPSLMAYATAGYAWAHTDVSRDTVASSSHFLNGYQLGFGSELMMTPKSTLRLEYLYTDLGDRTLAHGAQVNTFDTTSHTVRAGLTFRF